MSDRDESTGQFAESGADLTGEAAANHNLGFTTKPEEPAEKGPDDAKELGESFAEMRGHDPEPEPVLGLTREEDADEPKEALTQQQFAEHLGEERRAHESLIETVGNAEVAAYADALRAHLNGSDLEGQAAPETAAEKPAKPNVEAAASPEVQAMMDDGVQRNIAEAMAIPEVKQALEQEFAKASQVQQQYAAAIDTANKFAQASLIDAIPELSTLPAEMWGPALEALNQMGDQRVQRAVGVIGRVAELSNARQQIGQQQAYAKNQQFEADVGAEDARLVEMFGGDRAAADAATDATISYLAEHGYSRSQMADVFRTNPVLATAEARQTIWEAKKYRDIQKTKLVASSRSAPPVQRPGIAASAAERQASSGDARTAKARGRIDNGQGDSRDLGSLIGSLRRS